MIIFLYGPDTFRSRQKLKAIKDKFIADVDKSALNIEILDGSNLETSQFVTAVAAPPFLAKKRLVIIEDLISKNKGQKVQNEILSTLDKDGLKDTVIVFWEGGLDSSKTKKSARRPVSRSLGEGRNPKGAGGNKPKTVAKRSGLLLARLQKENFAQEFKLLDETEVYRFTVNEIQSRDGEIEPRAARLLADLVGNNLWQMNSEINKLIAYAGNKGKQITIEDVEQLVKTKLDDDIFKLTEALGQKNKQLALKLIADQLKSGTNPTELLAKIIWQFRNLLLVKSFVEENGSGYASNRLTFQLGLHPFVIKKTMAQVKNHQAEDLKKIYRHLMTIDYKIKTSQASPEVLFDLLVVKQ